MISEGVQHRVFYRDGYPSRYQPRPTGLNFGEQTGTGVFPLVIAVPLRIYVYFCTVLTILDCQNRCKWAFAVKDYDFSREEPSQL